MRSISRGVNRDAPTRETAMEPFYQDELTTIYHGDCLEALRGIPDGAARMVWTDPPYGHGNQDGDLAARRCELEGRVARPIANDRPDEFRALLDGMLLEAARIMEPASSVCCVCTAGGGGSPPTFAWVAERMDQQGLQFFHAVVWDKTIPGLGWRYRRQYEFVMVAQRRGSKLAWRDGAKPFPNVVRWPKPRGAAHPNAKPVSLIAAFLMSHTEPGDLVVDPCMGGGATLVAAKRLGRRAIGIELDRGYCEAAASMLAQGTLGLLPDES